MWTPFLGASLKTSHVAACLKLMKPRWTGPKEEPCVQRPRWWHGRVHPILQASLVPQTLNNLETRWQASITTLACSYSLHRLKQPRSFLTMLQPNFQTCISKEEEHLTPHWEHSLKFFFVIIIMLFSIFFNDPVKNVYNLNPKPLPKLANHWN